jgi:hypothetical protein
MASPTMQAAASMLQAFDHQLDIFDARPDPLDVMETRTTPHQTGTSGLY